MGKRQLAGIRYAACVVVALFAHALLAVEEPEGYRTELYDDLVPATLTGATVVNALEVQKLQQDMAAVVIDVIPEQRRPDDLPDGQLWFPVSHKGVPGAIWLPDTGFGVLSEVTEEYFKEHLASATGQNAQHPVVFYCRSNCWMSWNAAKRALSYGYKKVYWFADGIDDWAFEDLDFEILTPAPGKRQADEIDDPKGQSKRSG
ncbi:MAG: PQQ-dependent catabolism-associated CXXCW motif protein [Granulosicoccus sp.]|nr:PQQ-dependent catabolism-associated CXXCW motif protein [Granulosicoccus sp.]